MHTVFPRELNQNFTVGLAASSSDGKTLAMTINPVTKRIIFKVAYPDAKKSRVYDFLEDALNDYNAGQP